MKIEEEIRRTWNLFKSTWMGVSTFKNPCDAWIYQEIIFNTKPDVLIETGTALGGSAIFFADMFSLMGKGAVISIDIERDPKRIENPRVKYIIGDSKSDSVIEEVRRLVDGAKVMVVLDSDHVATHVREELEKYSPMVGSGHYLIVEDTWWMDGAGGPREAVDDFLANHPEFSVDKECERFGATNNPGGFLRKK